MAAGQISNYAKKPRYVTCGACRWFQRDTQGRNFNVETGEYYMGVCAKGLKPDTEIKQFANKPRECESYGEVVL